MSADRSKVSIHWFRRDLRLADNHGLFRALAEHGDVLPLFIFDTHILDRLENKADRRVDFIHRALLDLKKQLEERGGSLMVKHGSPEEVWQQLTERYDITTVTANHDHEPYALQRDARVLDLLREKGIPFRTFKDISIFERNEVMKDDGGPYTVFTPYSRKWKALFTPDMAAPFYNETGLDRLWKSSPHPFPALEDMGFLATDLQIPPSQVNDDLLTHYAETRNIPEITGTSRMSVHLRFGTVSPRALVRQALAISETYLNELVWREFFMQVLWHFPKVIDHSFKPAYDNIAWENDESQFNAWCEAGPVSPWWMRACANWRPLA